MIRVPILLFLVVTAVLAIRQGRAAEDPAPVPVQVRFRESEARPGDVVHLELRFVLPPGAVLTDPVLVKGMEKRKLLGIEKVRGGLDLGLLVDSLDPFTVPGLQVPFMDQGGSPGTVASEPVRLRVVTDLPQDPATARVRPIKDLVAADPSWGRSTLLYGAAGVCAVLLAAGGVWWFSRRRRAKGEVLSPVPPHTAAYQALEVLRARRSAGQMDDKGYYFALSEIVRGYMERIRAFPALEMTTEEITSKVRSAQDREVVQLLRDADLVKFAAFTPTRSRAEEHWSMAWKYVGDTTDPDPCLPVGPKPTGSAKRP